MRKFLITASAALILLFGSLKAYLYWHQPLSNQELEHRLVQLPKLSLSGLDGSAFLLEKGHPLVLIYFNSDCDHCQREIEDIKANMNLFSACDIVLMSSQSLDVVNLFASHAGLGSYTNVRFVKIAPDELARVFGSLSLPQLFIYSAEGSLVKVFSGETKADEIAGILNN